MKIREFITIDADIDVYDDVCEELAIAFCGPMALTEEGEKHFSDVLDYEIEIDQSGDFMTAEVKIDGEDGNGWKRRLRKAKDFFYSAAGYCAFDDYQKWFKEQEWGQYAIDPDANMIITVYKDTTIWFTEEEMLKDNLCEMSFPRKLVQEYYNNIGGNINSFVEWIQDVCTADDTEGLFQFCRANGFTAVPMKS